jgi:hypothetical protein
MKIVICSSTRFNVYIKILADKLKKVGNEVSIPSDVPFPLSKSPIEQVANKLTYEMLIKNADLILIFNANDYIGVSTFLELGIAIYLRKQTKILFPTTKYELKILSISQAHKLSIDTDFIRQYMDEEIVENLSKFENQILVL